jgi:ACT domain-containing protein
MRQVYFNNFLMTLGSILQKLLFWKKFDLSDSSYYKFKTLLKI